jgi:hypothetical protein
MHQFIATGAIIPHPMHREALRTASGADRPLPDGAAPPRQVSARVLAAAAPASVNESKKLVRRVPSETKVARWVAEAKTLPRAVHH